MHRLFEGSRAGRREREEGEPAPAHAEGITTKEGDEVRPREGAVEGARKGAKEGAGERRSIDASISRTG